MKFTWDEAKRQANFRKHGFNFADAAIVFEGATFTFEDDRFAYGEQRFVTIGILHGVIVVIAHTEVDEDLVRVISMRKATKYEQKLYFERFTD
ncbi:MAG: BrnT family toxin [Chloroflexota bacterium]